MLIKIIFVEDRGAIIVLQVGRKERKLLNLRLSMMIHCTCFYLTYGYDSNGSGTFVGVPWCGWRICTGACPDSII